MSEVSVVEPLEQAPVTPEIAGHASHRPRGRPKKQTTPAKRAVPKSYARVGPRRRANTLRPVLRKLNIGTKNAGQSPSPPRPDPERVVARDPSVNNGNEAARPVTRTIFPRPAVFPGLSGEGRGRNPESHQINDDPRGGHGSLPPPQTQLHSRYRQAGNAESDLANKFVANDVQNQAVQLARPSNSIFGNGSQASFTHPHTPYPQPARAISLPLLRPLAATPNLAHSTSYFSLINDDHHAPAEPTPTGSTLVDPTPTDSTPAFPNFTHLTPANPTLTYPTLTAPNRPDAGTPTIGAAAMTRVHNATIGLAFMTGTLQYPPGGGNVVVYTRPQALQDEQADLV